MQFKSYILTGFVAISLIIFGVNEFYKKTYLEFELVAKIKGLDTGFYPYAYVFFHKQENLDSYFRMNSYTKTLKEKTPKNLFFDFNNYSYCVVYGREINSMYHSLKTTYFDDISPSYASCRKFGRVCVFIEYIPSNDTNYYTYFYRVKRNINLRGFDGL